MNDCSNMGWHKAELQDYFKPYLPFKFFLFKYTLNVICSRSNSVINKSKGNANPAC